MRFVGAAILILISTNSYAADRREKAAEKQPEKVAEAQAPEKKEKPTEAASPAPALIAPKGPARVDFDDRLLQGQTNRLGAVYLYQRKEPVLPSLLDRRKSFRSEIKRDLLE